MLAAKKVLLLYITVLSGHHHAAVAVEKAIGILSPETVVKTINCFNYTNPILEKIIVRTYSGIIKRTPEVWEYLYDNPKLVKKTQRFKDLIHRYNSSKMKSLIGEFEPDVIVCTQAFPCGMVADYKTSFNRDIPLVGILTDFHPHSYWIYEAVDRYVVASELTKAKLVENGIEPERICVLGIPIDLGFNARPETDKLFKNLRLVKGPKTVLIMGGSRGIGPIRRMVMALDRTDSDVQIIVVSGQNAKLYSYFAAKSRRFKKKVVVTKYAENINELMSISDMIITKPGGLTVSEALAKGLPIVIINPIPGQEAKNTQFLTQHRVALRAKNESDLAILVDRLCRMPSKLRAMKKASAILGRPGSALDTARMVLGL